MNRSLSRLFGVKPRRALRKRPHLCVTCTRPALEVLEYRTVPSVTLSPATGYITIKGTDYAAETATVTIDDQGTPTVFDDQVDVVQNSLLFGEAHTYNLWKWTWFGYMRNVKGISFYGYGGNDKFDNRTGLVSVAHGGSGHDLLLGGLGDDQLVGDDGNDVLRGRAGDDVLRGGTGNDHLYGDAGDDWLTDVVIAGEFDLEGGNDVLHGGDGNDTLQGWSGVDWLYGEAGDDDLDGGKDGDADFLYGGAGADQFKAEWYWLGFFKLNRDAPKDFAPGDQVV